MLLRFDMSRRRQRLILAVIVAAGLATQLPLAPSSPELGFFTYANLGENLRHGIQQRHSASTPSLHMPVSTLTATMVYELLRSLPWRFWLAIIGSLLALLVMALGCLLTSIECGLLASVILLGLGWFIANDYPQSYYALILLTVAALSVWRARQPSLWRTLLLALALGSSLLYRSTLVFFAPALIIWEWTFHHHLSLRAYWKHMLCLFVVPILFLIPWWRMNWVVEKRFIPLEHGRQSNLVAGVLGFVAASEGEARSVVADPIASSPNGSIAGWAAREIIRHPLRYAQGYCRRLAHVASFHPLLFLFALAGLWAHRRKHEFHSLGLLVLYFVGIHGFVSIDAQYFFPLWSLLAILSACWGSSFLEWAPSSRDSTEYRLSRNAAFVGLGLVLLQALHAAITINSYATLARSRSPRSDEALQKALVSRPEDAWLLAERGERRLNEKQLRGAIEDLKRSLIIQPAFPKRRGLLLAWAQALQGDSQPLFAWELPPEDRENPELEFEARILKACAYARLGRTREIQENLRKARGAWQSQVRRPYANDSASARAALLKLRSSFPTDPTPFRLLTSKERMILFDEVLKLAPEAADYWLHRAHAAVESGDRPLALKSLTRARSLDLNANQIQYWAQVSRLLPKPSRTRRPAEPPAVIPAPDAVDRHIEKARTALRAGNRELTMESMARAEALVLSSDQMLALLGLYQGLQDSPQALRIVRQLLERRPNDPGLWIEQAKLALGSENREAALRSLERAEALKPDADARHRISLLYQELREYGRALSLLGQLTAETPGRAIFRSDRGLCLYLSGLGDEAIDDLKTAIRLDPQLMPAYVTLGSIYAARGNYEQALSVYDQALSAAMPRDSRPLRDIIRKSRYEVLAKIAKRKT